LRGAGEKSMKNQILFTAVLSAMLVFSGCSASGAAVPAADALQQTAQPVKPAVEISGSVSSLPLMLALSEGLAGHNGFTYNVTASGKNASLEALTAGTSEVAVLEGDASDVPKGAAGQPVAYQAVAVIVNPSSNISALTAEQIKSIFAGESSDWADFGGKGTITIVMPEENDGFRQAFEELFSIRASVNGIMQSLLPKTAVISSDMEKEVESTAGAIGICPAASLSSMEHAVSIGGVSLNGETLKNGTYPASRTVMLILRNDASDSANEFFTYCTSDEAVKAIQASGFMPIK